MFRFSQRHFFNAKPVIALRHAWHGAEVHWRTSDLLRRASKSSLEVGEILTLIDSIRDQEKNDNKRGQVLSDTRGLLSSIVLPHAQMYQVSSDLVDSDLHQAILDKEAVHQPEDGVNELRTYRFGDPTSNKDCQTLYIPHASGRRLIGQIFRFHFAASTNTEGQIYVDQLPGNVDQINASKPQSLTGEENGTGYYSISADFNVKAAGRALVSRLFEAKPKNGFETTISPIREILKPDTSKYDRGQLLALSDDDIRRAVLDFIAEKKDMPSRSHLGNGAFVGWIHINRDSIRDPIIVNYIYDRELLSINRKNYIAGVIPMSEPLSRLSKGDLVIAPSQRIARTLMPS